ncbi:DUF6316 family protein [Pseudomonadales bacterium]|nr:DUF6316 family protein [Pseudomonadales bacterium]
MTKKTIKVRKTDAPFLQPVQSNRYLEINNDWFFFTHEKDLLGPYRSHLIAEHAAMVYIDKMLRINQEGITMTAKMKGADTDKNTNILYFKHPNWNV